MKLPPQIDFILELAEEIYRHYFRRHNVTADGPPSGPAPELAQLKAHLASLPPATLYFCITALEIGRRVVHPQNFFTAYLAASGAFPRHFEAVNRLLKDPEHLALYLESGLDLLQDAGLDINALFQPTPTASKPRAA